MFTAKVMLSYRRETALKGAL